MGLQKMNNNKKERKQQEQQRHSNSEITRGKNRGIGRKRNIGESKISFFERGNKEREFEEGAVRLFRGAEASAGMRWSVSGRQNMGTYLFSLILACIGSLTAVPLALMACFPLTDDAMNTFFCRELIGRCAAR